jgi:hypothetical protein
MADAAPDWATPASPPPAWANQPSTTAQAPAWAAPQRAPGATGVFDQIGQTFHDLTSGQPATHDPNALEQGIMNVAGSKPIQNLQANYQSAVTNGLFMQPVRAAMENLGVGRQQGETDASLHQRYNQAVIGARQQAQQQMDASTVGAGPNPTLGDRAARLAQQTGNVAANIVANPEYFVLPSMGIGGNVATRVATAGLGNAAVGSVSDAAAQGMDMISGVKKDFDVKQNLAATLTSGLFGAGIHGAGEAAPFVADMFKTRGMDTTPPADPRPQASMISPMTTDHVTMNAADHAQYQNLLQTGDVDDIKNFFQGRNGPQPSWQDVNTWVEHRDNPPVSTNGVSGPDPSQQPDFNYNDEYNAHAEQQYAEQNRQAVEDHINNQMSGWKNAPDVEVVHSPDQIADPAMRAQIAKEDPNNDALGFLGADGKVRVFSGRITDPDTANAVLFHEGLGHFGLAQKFGDQLDQTIGTMLDRNVNQLSKDTDVWQRSNPNAYGGDRIRAAEEVLAEASQNGQVKAGWQDALTSTARQFGRKMGMKLSYSDGEVRNILSMAHDAVVNGKPNAEMNGFRGATQDGTNKFMKAQPQGEALGEEADKMYRDAVWGETPQARLLRAQRTLAMHGGVHPEARMIADQASEEMGYPKVEDAQRTVEQPETMADHFFSPNSPEINPDATIMSDQAKAIAEARANGPKFVRQDAMGREQTDPDLLEPIDQMKANPRFWADPEYRANVIELARSQQGVSDGPAESSIPAPSGFKSEAEAREAQAVGNKFIMRQQAAEPGHRVNDLEAVYNDLEKGYTPTQRPWEEDRQAALDAGFSPSQIKALKETNPGDLSTKLYRIQSAANMAYARIDELNQKLGTPDWSAKDQAAYIQTLADRAYLVARVKGERSEYARALNVSKAASSYNESTMQAVADLLRSEGSGLADMADDPTKFMKVATMIKGLMNGSNPAGADAAMAAIDKPYWEQYLTSFHYNAMLSGLATHVKAPLDMMTGIAHSIIDHALAMPIGKARAAVEGLTGRTTAPGITSNEVAARLFGTARSVFDHEVYVKTLEAARTGEGSAVLPSGASVPTNPANSYSGVKNPRLGLLSKPTDLIVAQDTFFRSHAVSQALYGLGAREAEAQLKAAGTPYTRDDVMTLGATIAKQPPISMLQEARSDAEKMLLLNPNRLTSWIDKVKAIGPGASVPERFGSFVANNLAPFIRVAANSLTTRIIERSPLAILSSATRKQFMAGGPGADLVMARVAYGTAKLGLLWAAADTAYDKITGQGPTDPNKKKELEASGYRPNAVHEDGRYNTGGTLAMSLNPFDVHNSTAQMVSSMRQAYEKGANEGQVGIGLKLALGSILHSFEAETWVDAVAPAVEAASDNGATAGQKINQFIGDEAKTWVPNALNQVGRMTNPNQVDTRAPTDEVDPTNIAGSITNNVQSAIPGLNRGLPTRYSVYGNPIPNGQSLTGIHTMIPGLQGNGVEETKDPAELELNRLANMTKAAIVTPVQQTVKLDDGTSKKLTTTQFQEYQRVAGRAIVETVRTQMSTPEWRNMSDSDKIVAVRSIQTDMKKAARESLFDAN